MVSLQNSFINRMDIMHPCRLDCTGDWAFLVAITGMRSEHVIIEVKHENEL